MTATNRRSFQILTLKETIMAELSNAEIIMELQARGIEVMDDTRSYQEIASQFGILPVRHETESLPVGVQEPELKV